MTDLPISIGVDASMVQDIAPIYLPPNMFSTARNVRFQDGRAVRMGVEQLFLTQTGLAATYLLPIVTPESSLWFVGTGTKAYALKGQTLTEITNEDDGYGGGNWNGGVFSGAAVVTNGQDVPQVWNPVDTTQPLVNLPNWPSTWRARVLRPYLRVLVAMGISISGTEKPYLLATSHPADPGALPPSWDPADPTRDVMNVDVADTTDFLVDGLALGQVFVIYKSNSTWLMYPYGGGGGGLNSLFRIQGLYRESGLLAQDCVCAFGGDAQGRGSKHFVATGDDIIINNGQAAQSILTSRLRKWLNRNIDSTSFANSFALTHDQEHEVRFYFPQQGSIVPDMMVVWNWDNNNINIANTTPLRHAAFGRHDTETGTWEEAEGSWETDIGSWTAGIDLRFLHLGIGVGADSLYTIDDLSFSQPVTSLGSILERLDFPYVPTDNGPAPNFDNFKYYKWMWPRISAPVGTRFLFTFGSRDEVNDEVPIVWQAGKPFVVGTDKFVEIDLNVKYLSYSIYCEESVLWKFDGFTLGVEVRGRYG